MLTALREVLVFIFFPLVYGGGAVLLLLTLFKRAEWGLWLFVVLIPQPNIYFKFHPFPLGTQFMNLFFMAILLGILIQKIGFTKTSSYLFIFPFLGLSFISVIHTCLLFSVSSDQFDTLFLHIWKDYALMIGTYFLVVSIVKTDLQVKRMTMIITIVLVFIGFRTFRGYEARTTYAGESRAGGPFETVGLGSNHFGAFMSFCCATLLGRALVDKNWKRKLICVAGCGFGIFPLLYSYSRGAYAGFAAAALSLFLLKNRILLVASLLILLSWDSVLPPSVVDRIKMTGTSSEDLDHASAVRLKIWDQAIAIFKEHPFFGVGSYGFYFMGGAEGFMDTHNFYLKILCEQGVIGLIFLVPLLLKALWSGLTLFLNGHDSFYKALGLGFIGCTIAMIVNNIFGDRWSYFCLGGYFWVFWALVDRGILLCREARTAEADQTVEFKEPILRPVES